MHTQGHYIFGDLILPSSGSNNLTLSQIDRK